ncbi:sensor histidine kinase [Streptomyces sp. NPDC048248]|uniref:sensor histidine kinase n=1 Tax=Streptomyces sp. NPDC048248 TaxID=3365523 RepID=UPI003710F5DA
MTPARILPRPLPDRWRARLPGAGLWLLLCVPPATAFNALSGRELWGTALAFPLLGVCVLLRGRRPLVSLALPLAASLCLSLELFTPAYCLALALFGYLSGVRLPRARPALRLVAAVALVGLPLSALFGRSLWPWFSLLLTLLLNVVLPWLLGRYRRQYGALVRTGWQLAEQMEREQQAIADRTRLRERARIAGDMHDSLGHDLALIALRAGALEVDPRLDADRRAAAGELRAAAGAATERLREIIGVLRADDEAPPRTPSGESVPALIEDARSAGMTVTLEQVHEAVRDDDTGGGAGDAGDIGLPAMTGHALHRAVQESLTNAAKHAPGAPVRVRLVRAAGHLQLTVVNGPRPEGPAPEAVSGGSGLVGLDERVRLAGGTLHTGPTPEGGFRVSARLPTTGGTPPSPTDRREGTAARRELERVRHEVRRRLRQTVVVPLVVITALYLLMGIFTLVSPSWTVLDRGHYDALRTGMPRAATESALPFFALDAPPDGTPSPPHGWSCVYYSVRPGSDSAYQLCFAEDRLVRKAVVHRRD